VETRENARRNVHVLVFPGHRVCMQFLCFIDTDIPVCPSFYGINLNQNVVLQQIGFDGKTGTPWERLFKLGLGNLIITALGFLPGIVLYYCQRDRRTDERV